MRRATPPPPLGVGGSTPEIFSFQLVMLHVQKRKALRTQSWATVGTWEARLSDVCASGAVIDFPCFHSALSHMGSRSDPVLLDSAKLFCIYLSMPIYTLHEVEDRKGGDLFLFTHLTVEVSVLTFIYLWVKRNRSPPSCETTVVV